MDNRKEGNVISLHPQKIDYGRRRIVRAVISLLVLGALEEASTGFKGVKTAGQITTSLFKLIGEPNTSSETNLLSSETSITVVLGKTTFDPELRLRKESPNIRYEKHDVSVGNHDTEIDLGNMVIENALIMRVNPRSITKVINNIAVAETVYDEWILFSNKGKISFIKYDDLTSPHIHFDRNIKPSERVQYGYKFDRFEKDSMGGLFAVVKNERGDEIFTSRASPRIKEDNKN